MTKKTRKWILCFWAGASGIVLLAFMCGWHPTCAARPNRALAEARDYIAGGGVHAAAGHYEEALAYYKKALALVPDHVQAHMGMGECYTRLDRKADAIAAYEKVLTLVPNGVWADGARRCLAELRGE